MYLKMEIKLHIFRQFLLGAGERSSNLCTDQSRPEVGVTVRDILKLTEMIRHSWQDISCTGHLLYMVQSHLLYCQPVMSEIFQFTTKPCRPLGFSQHCSYKDKK